MYFFVFLNEDRHKIFTRHENMRPEATVDVMMTIGTPYATGSRRYAQEIPRTAKEGECHSYEMRAATDATHFRRSVPDWRRGRGGGG